MAERRTTQGQETLNEPISAAEVRLALAEPRPKLRVQFWPPAIVPSMLLTPIGATREEGPLRVLCLGPAEWLIVATAQRPAASLHLAALLTAVAPGRDYALVDVSAGLQTLELRGPTTRHLLAKGCGLDLHPRRFAAGRCAQTKFAGLPVIIDCPDDSGRFDLYVSRSYVSWITAWLEAALALDCP
jgi:sarcosine oxidase subunit gamma